MTDGSNPLENVDVILEDAEENQFTGKTGSAGGCTIRNVPEGTYDVVASLNGYQDYEGTITVNEDSTTLNISLTESVITPTVSTYYFTSYADAEGNTEWGSGSVETTGNVSGGFTEVEVITNAPEESFIGQKYFITSNAETDGTIYPLYTDAGETAAGIYVSLSTTPSG